MIGQIQEMLLQKQVRLIAINDGHDSLNGDDDFFLFRNIMNEWYEKDTSKKIRSSFKAKDNSGKHVASTTPYGYLKDPEREPGREDEIERKYQEAVVLLPKDKQQAVLEYCDTTFFE